jgi:hypothetical protein
MVTGVVDSTIGAMAPRVTAAHGPLIAVWSQRLYMALSTFQWAWQQTLSGTLSRFKQVDENVLSLAQRKQEAKS